MSAARRFKAYPAYKDSGVEWLGEIPAHWTESKVKFLGRYINGFPFKPDDWSIDGRPIIRIQNLTNPDAAFNRFAGDLGPRYRVTRGDILISWSASLGLFVWSGEEDGWLNQHIFKVNLREDRFIDRAFFIWRLSCPLPRCWPVSPCRDLRLGGRAWLPMARNRDVKNQHACVSALREPGILARGASTDSPIPSVQMRFSFSGAITLRPTAQHSVEAVGRGLQTR